MDVKELSIAGSFEITPKQFGDSRGAFMEYFKADVLSEAIGHSFELVQANCSVSSAGVLRGVHFADVPPGQAKYVTCARGAVLDVVVDIRVGSPTFGQWDSVLLDTLDRKAIYVGEGLGHAFMALTDDATVLYLCSAGYNPTGEHGIHPLCPDVGIDWPTTAPDGSALERHLSDKDTAAPTLLEAKDQGLLPTYDSVSDYLQSLA